ncbi:hypothetical protein IU427_07350 [Nocardia beijingensis]|uniref:hypothetical protein n=1 Tax=Nocardia beijingensis TaxID=95162 RepID=UPI0018959E37|nr:hypothetical protein [Nocardia beijingensis]MBF6465000.1 hypothetical protein [Nocardia beijingensis]
MLKLHRLAVAVGTALSALVVPMAAAAATPAAGYQAASAPCGFREEAGLPTELWWKNCSDQGELIKIHRPSSPDGTYCVPAHKDEWVASFDYDNPLGSATKLTLIRKGC